MHIKEDCHRERLRYFGTNCISPALFSMTSGWRRYDRCHLMVSLLERIRAWHCFGSPLGQATRAHPETKELHIYPVCWEVLEVSVWF